MTRTFSKSLKLLIVAILGVTVQTGSAQMRIDSIDLKAFKIPLKKAFKTSKASSSSCYGIFVLIHARDAVDSSRQFTALGSILPRTLVTNESKADAWAGALAMRRILIGRTLNAGNLAGDLALVETWLENLNALAKMQKLPSVSDI